VFALLLIAGIAAAGVYFFKRDLLDPVLGPANTEVVALGEAPPKEKVEDKPAEKGGFELGAEAGDRALSAALSAAEEQNAVKMSGVMRALRPSIDQALGLATEEAELAAEGGLVEYKLDEAQQALKYNRTAKAISLYEDVLKKDGRNADAYVGLGWAYLQEGDNNEAVVKFQRGLELDARNGDALIGLGSAERQRGNLEAAMRAYDLYLGRHPRGDKVSIAQYQLDALKRQLGL
jgi:tetratricopeptide (TPR) repeat protein